MDAPWKVRSCSNGNLFSWDFGFEFFISVFSAPLGAGAFADSETRALPNLVFVVTDDQRADTLGALGNTEILTPSLDRLVRAGVTFRRAYSGYPICYASRAQILTGCNVFTALENYPRSQIREGLDTLAETLSGAGYSTFYCGKWHNDGNPLVRGYQHTAAPLLCWRRQACEDAKQGSEGDAADRLSRVDIQESTKRSDA